MRSVREDVIRIDAFHSVLVMHFSTMERTASNCTRIITSFVRKAASKKKKNNDNTNTNNNNKT